MKTAKLKRFTCSQCSFASAHKKSLQNHILLHSDEKPISCPVKGCSYRCRTKSNLYCHNTRHHTDPATRNRFHCDFENCGYTTSAKGALRLHSKRVHDPNGTKNNHCTLCSYCSHTKAELRSHIKVHTGEKQFNCGFCYYGTNTKHCLQSHLGSVHNKLDSTGKLMTSGKPEEQCPHPGCTYRTIHGLQSHIKRHQSDEVTLKYKCTFPGCTYRSKESGNFRRHVRIYHDPKYERPHGCPVCPKRFHHAFELRGHIGKHTNEKLYKCETCEFATVYRENLHRHKRGKHSEKVLGPGQTFSCGLCNYSGRTQVTLDAHYMNIHPGEKKFKCPRGDCDYRTDYVARLTTHKWKHEPKLKDRKPVVCLFQGCNARFGSYSGLGIHRVCAHGVGRRKRAKEAYRFELCSFTYGNRKNFMIHASLHGPTAARNYENSTETKDKTRVYNCFVLMSRIYLVEK